MPNPDISHAHAARHRRAPTTPISTKIDAELLRRVDQARGNTPRTRVIEAALGVWLERRGLHDPQHDAAGLPRCPLCGRPMREMRRPALSGNEGKEPKND